MDDVKAMTMLHGLAMHSAGAGGLDAVLREICEVAIALSQADFGNVQLVDPATSDLSIVAQRGFPSWWIDYWNAAAKSHGVCGSALEAGTRVIVEDVASSPLFVGKPSLQVQLAAEVRAVQSTPLLTRTGKAVGVFSTHHRHTHQPKEPELRWLDLLARQAADLIENAQVSAALRDSELRFRALATATSAAVYCMSPDWSHMRFLQGKGFISDTLQASGDWLTTYIDAADQPRVLEAIRDAIRNKTAFDLEHRVRRVDGTLGWTRSRAIPVLGPNDDIVEWFGTATDVTEAREAVTQLFDEQQRLHALLESLPVGVAFTDTPGCGHVMGNKALLEQFGAGPGDNVSASAPDVQAHGRQILYWHEGQPVAEGELPLQRAAREGRTIEPTELLVRLPSGKEFFTEVCGAPIRDSQGNVVGAVTVCTDITDRKEALEAREHARLQDEFLSVLGHELRNPLAAISSAADLLGRSAAPGTQDAMRQIVHRQAAVLKRLVEDLLDVSRVSLGILSLQRDSVSLREVLSTAAASARPITEQRSQYLALGQPKEDVHFFADEVRLLQILGNLLDNASKYSGSGARIQLSGALEGTNIVLRCKDNGRGIDPQALQRVFEPLVRLEPARRDAPGGLGLGLALVRRLAEFHGGSASAISLGPDAGSEFIITIPFEAAAARAKASGTPSDADTRSQLQVAIVDDNPDVLQVLALAVERSGHQVHRFADGPSALAGIPALVPDAVLLDTGLPGMSGFELLARLREQPGLRNTRFIGMSGLAPPAQTRDGGARFDFFLSKPIDIRGLTTLLGRQRPPAVVRPSALLVEDHEELAAATEALLRREGLEVIRAASGREALDIAARVRPRILLCDMNLPDMQGLELVERIQKDLNSRETLVVMVSARSEDELAPYNKRARELHVDAFIPKPILVERLRALVAQLE